MTRGSRKSFQACSDCSTTTVTMIGLASGSITYQKVLTGPTPSIRDASSSSFGIWVK